MLNFSNAVILNDFGLLMKLEVETGFEPVVLQLCRLSLWAAQPLDRED
jgi:hypothetical protein